MHRLRARAGPRACQLAACRLYLDLLLLHPCRPGHGQRIQEQAHPGWVQSADGLCSRGRLHTGRRLCGRRIFRGRGEAREVWQARVLRQLPLLCRAAHGPLCLPRLGMRRLCRAWCRLSSRWLCRRCRRAPAAGRRRDEPCALAVVQLDEVAQCSLCLRGELPAALCHEAGLLPELPDVRQHRPEVPGSLLRPHLQVFSPGSCAFVPCAR